MNSGLSIVLRPVTEDDLPVLRHIYASTRAEELAAVPWSAEQKEAFLTMQFQAQRADYQSNYPDATFDIVECEGQIAGRLYVHRRPAEIRIIDIALLPKHRGNGIGTHLLSELIAESEASEKPLSIHVEKQNPALRLYQRLGFTPTDESAVYLLMHRPRNTTAPCH